MHKSLNDTRPRETDQRPWFCQDYIAEQCKTGRYTPGGRGRQQAKIREFCLGSFDSAAAVFAICISE